jgi:chaperone BCS1
MEDIDAAFHHSISRTPENSETLKKAIAGDKSGPAPPSTDTPKISLSGLLNALDGVGAQEGRLLFATTNRYETLDAALRRPGRMDVHVEFKLASQYQAAQLFKRFYMPDDVTPTKVEEVADDGESDKDSGYATPPKEKLVDVELPEGEKLLASQGKEPDLAELVLMSEKFKERVPDREFSMAAIQGYLMMHKGRPYDALECAEAWVQEEKAKKGKVVKDTV